MPARGFHHRGLRLRPWRAGDEDAFEARADYMAEMARGGHDWRRGAPGPTWTVYRADGRVEGIGGGVDYGDGTFRLWAHLAPFARRDWPQAVELATRVMLHLRREHGAKRFTALASVRLRGSVRTLQRLGLRPAGMSEIDGYWLMRSEG